MANVTQTEAKIGRPSKFGPGVIDELERNISEGLPYYVACNLSGIAYSTYRNWMVAAESEDADGLSQKLSFVVENPEKAESFAAAGLESIKPYDWKEVAAMYFKKVYKGLL